MANSEEISKTLHHCRKRAHRLRTRLLAVLLAPCISLFLVGALGIVLYTLDFFPFIGWPTFILLVGLPNILLAIVPTDHKVIGAVYWMMFTVAFIMFVVLTVRGYTQLRDCELALSVCIVSFLRFVGYDLALLALFYFLRPWDHRILCGGRAHSRTRLFQMWRGMRMFMAINGLTFLSSYLYLGTMGLSHIQDVISMVAGGAGVLLWALVSTAHNRARLQAWLRHLLTVGEATSAATLSSLIGHVHPSTAYRNAMASFKGLPFDQLTMHDLSTNQDTGLASKTVPAQLGHVQAFLSHSWHDSGKMKWERLLEWRATKFSGRNILLWLDKACIDQTNISESLSCLPIFLAGCAELLVVAGATYPMRLWCVMELFTFMQMGASKDRLTLVSLHSTSTSLADVKNILSNFRSSDAKCFVEEDRARLLGIIEASFGSLAAFDMTVRNITCESEAQPLQIQVSKKSAHDVSISLES